MRNNNKTIICVDGIQATYIKQTPQVYTTPFSIRSNKWYDETSDPDPFNPSCPHLHSKDGPYKMNVYTGEIYNTQTKKIISDYQISKKELRKLWSDKKFVKFALIMRKQYYEKYPQGILPDIPEYCTVLDEYQTLQNGKSHSRRSVYVKVKLPMTHLKSLPRLNIQPCKCQ